MSRQFSVRPATADDRAAMIRLMSEMHGSDATARYERLYLANPHGEAVSWVAVDDETGEVVAQTSLFPRRIMVAGTERVGAIGGDTFVSPTARRQGLATRLHAASRVDMLEHGVEFHFGAPVIANLHALAKVGGVTVSDFFLHVRPLTSAFVAEKLAVRLPAAAPEGARKALAKTVAPGALAVFNARRRPVPAGYSAERNHVFGDEWDRWIEEHVRRDGVFCVRDAAYMTYRYEEGQCEGWQAFQVRRDGAIAGMFALEFTEDGRDAFLGDLFAAFDVPSLQAALRLAAREAKRAGCDSISIRATTQPALVEALTKDGFFERGGGETPALSLTPPEDVDEPDLLRDGAWFFVERDQDLD
ncbi:MAG: GNAT family N-acetyltransferase [Gemmatimonadota bacterium]